MAQTLWIVQELGYEYDDSWYRQPECGGGTPVSAYQNKKNADEKCKELNKVARREGRYESEDGPVDEYYQVIKVVVEDDDLVTYDDARTRVKEAREFARNTVKEAFVDGALKLFNDNPELTSFAFKCYTDYFNDGDACHFHVYSDNPDVNGKCGYEVECETGREYDPKSGKYKQVKPPSVEHQLQGKVSDFLRGFASEDLEEMFGDHKRVTATHKPLDKTKVAVEVEDYTEHD